MGTGTRRDCPSEPRRWPVEGGHRTHSSRPSPQESQALFFAHIGREAACNSSSPSGAPVPCAPGHTWSFLAGLGHTYSRRWGHRWLGTRWQCPCSGGCDVCWQRWPSLSLQDTEQEGPQCALDFERQEARPRLCPEPRPLGQESCQGRQAGLCCQEEEVRPRESRRKVRPPCWQPSSACPALGRWLPGRVT